MVVEEMTPDVVILEVSRWPMMDDKGRPKFLPLPEKVRGRYEEDERIVLLSVAPEALHGKKRVRFGQTVQGEPVQIDDAFGVAIDPAKWPDQPGSVVYGEALSGLMCSPLYDVTAEAREMSRIVRLASIAPPVEEKYAAIAEEGEED
ncbi:hypothetical protein OIU91_03580 [Streptomyces sp. NBC_01456]|uniref:hypothetical protein n=1 Tax=unclassified Streptomyces TaxID=2593676 RepID=UPI002E33139E|nr:MULTISPECIES: hypothetical protein [unclassified Streptomyces]